MNDINLGNMKIPVIKPQKGVDYFTEAEKQELIEETTKKVNQTIEPKETERQANEQIRKSNEEDRKTQESTRMANENKRQSNEDIRENNETTRQNSENERQTSEQSRIEAEQSRNTAFNNQMTENEKAIQDIKDKIVEYNANAETKTNEFNSNAEQKTQTFNENANAKLQEINQIKDTTEAKITEINEKDEAQDTEISQIKQEQITQNEKIQQNTDNIEELKQENIELKAKDKELKAENERLREDLNNTVPSVSGEGENVTLKGTANARFKKFEVGGNSWQETRSGKNLFNATLIANTNIQVSDNGKTIIMPVIKSGNGITNTNKKLSELCPNLKVGDEVYLFLETTSSTNKYIHLNVSAYTWSKNTLRTITQNDLDSNVSLYGNRYQDGETDQVTISNFMITKVNDNTWEQYGAMPSPEFESPIRNVTGNVNVTVCNKNLFDSKAIPNFPGGSSGVNLTVDNEGTITIFNNTNSSGYINTNKTLKELCSALKVGDVAYLYLETTHTIKYIWLNGTNEIWNNGASKIITQEMLDGRISIYGGNTQTDTLKIQVTLNELSSKYKPHESQQISFLLAEGQKLMLGDYLADDGIHHKRKQFVLDGTETINLANIDRDRYPFGIDFSDILIKKSDLSKDLMSNYLKSSETSESFSDDNNIATMRQGSGSVIVWIFMPKSYFTGSTKSEILQEFKNILAQKKESGIPVTIEYPLAEEEIEAYTPEQQAVYDEIKKTAKSYGDVTHIFSTDEISLIFDVEANADIQAMFNNLQAQILAGEV